MWELIARAVALHALSRLTATIRQATAATAHRAALAQATLLAAHSAAEAVRVEAVSRVAEAILAVDRVEAADVDKH